MRGYVYKFIYIYMFKGIQHEGIELTMFIQLNNGFAQYSDSSLRRWSYHSLTLCSILSIVCQAAQSIADIKTAKTLRSVCNKTLSNEISRP